MYMCTEGNMLKGELHTKEGVTRGGGSTHEDG